MARDPAVLYLDSVYGSDPGAVPGDKSKQYKTAAVAAAATVAGDVISYTPGSVDTSNLPSVASGASWQARGTQTTPYSATFTYTAGASTVCEVLVTVKDINTSTLAETVVMDIWLSDSATGAGLTGTTASGAVAAKANSGVDLVTLVTKKALRVQTLSTGKYTLSITASGKTAYYPCVSIGGKTIVGAALQTSDYGA